MATTVTKSIGSAGGRDYSTIALWEAAIPSDLVAADQIWRGELYNDSEFAGVTIAARTVDATRYIELTCATGQSFVDNASVRSNALAYNQSNGVGIRTNSAYVVTITLHCSRVRFTNLQIQAAGSAGAFAIYEDTAHDNAIFTNCIISARNVFSLSGTGHLFVNCAINARSTGTVIGTNAVGTHRFEFCTFIGTGTPGTCGSIGYGTLTLENCAIFGLTSGFTTRSGGTLAGGHNGTDLSSAPGSSNQVSLTFANEFINTASDWRAKTGGSLETNGTPATSYTSVDISNYGRHASTPTIGAWQITFTASSTPNDAETTGRGTFRGVGRGAR